MGDGSKATEWHGPEASLRSREARTRSTCVADCFLVTATGQQDLLSSRLEDDGKPSETRPTGRMELSRVDA